MFFDHIITKDPYGIDRAVKPWNSGDAEPVGGYQSKLSVPSDPPEQIERCETCPFEDCTKGDDQRKCWYRLGKQPPQAEEPKTPKEGPKKELKKEPKGKKPPLEPQPPLGYDRQALDKAMVHACNDRDLAEALGLSLYMAKKWLDWRYRE